MKWKVFSREFKLEALKLVKDRGFYPISADG
jgi:transposase-like protein